MSHDMGIFFCVLFLLDAPYLFCSTLRSQIVFAEPFHNLSL